MKNQVQLFWIGYFIPSVNWSTFALYWNNRRETKGFKARDRCFMSEIWKNRKADDMETHMETSLAGMNCRNKDSYIKWWNKSFSNSVPDQDREQA